MIDVKKIYAALPHHRDGYADSFLQGEPDIEWDHVRTTQAIVQLTGVEYDLAAESLERLLKELKAIKEQG